MQKKKKGRRPLNSQNQCWEICHWIPSVWLMTFPSIATIFKNICMSLFMLFLTIFCMLLLYLSIFLWKIPWNGLNFLCTSQPWYKWGCRLQLSVQIAGSTPGYWPLAVCTQEPQSNFRVFNRPPTVAPVLWTSANSTTAGWEQVWSMTVAYTCSWQVKSQSDISKSWPECSSWLKKKIMLYFINTHTHTDTHRHTCPCKHWRPHRIRREK